MERDELKDLAYKSVQYRVKHNLTQSELAEKVKLSKPVIGKIEKADANVSLKSIIKLMMLLNEEE